MDAAHGEPRELILGISGRIGARVRLERQALFWLAALILLALVLYVLSGVLMPFAAGLALAYLLDPVADRLQKMGFNRLGASLLILALFTIVFVAVLILLLPLLAHQLAAFLERLPGYVMTLRGLAAEQGGEFLEKYGSGIFEKLGVSPGAASPDIQNSIGDLVKQGGQWISGFLKSLWSGGQALVGILSLLVVTPVVAFYMLVDWDDMIARVDSWVPVPHRRVVRRLARRINTAIAGFLRGQSLVCLFLGVWYGVGLSLIGLNFGLLIGISAGVLSFVPYVGSLMALVLSVGVAIVQGWPSWSLVLMALAVVGTGQFLEGNILTPRLVGHSVGLHPVWLMFALLAFGSLFGFTGLIVAVPVAAAIGVLVRFALEQYLASEIYSGRSKADDEGAYP